MELPASFIDELKARISLHALIGRKVELKQSGRQWKGCCPVHPETSPSFYVYDTHYHCFGCGTHGDAVEFVMLTEGLSHMEAVSCLANEVGLAVPIVSATEVLVPVPPGGSDAVTLSSDAVKRDIFNNPGAEAILGSAAKFLALQQKTLPTSILCNAQASIHLLDTWDVHYSWKLKLQLPIETYLELGGTRQQVEEVINEAFAEALRGLTSYDNILADIVPLLVDDPAWRDHTRRYAAGEGINNQGRAHSQNVAAREYQGLLFRSRPEIFLFRALKAAGVAFAPLPVVVGQDAVGQRQRRIEPDFMIFKDGLVTIVEIDGQQYHLETPLAASARLKFLTDEGARLERIGANECDTDDKAREAVGRLLLGIEKRRRARI